MKKKFTFKKLVVLLCVAYVGFTLVQQQITMGKIMTETNNAQKEISVLKEKNDKLQDEVKMINSDMYWEKRARERNFIKDGETPVINNK